MLHEPPGHLASIERPPLRVPLQVKRRSTNIEEVETAADLECDLHSGKLAEVGLKVVEFHLRRCPIVAAGTTLSVPHDPLHQGFYAHVSRCIHPAGERLIHAEAVLEGSSCRESITIRAIWQEEADV